MATVYALVRDGVDEWMILDALHHQHKVSCFQDYRLFLDNIRIRKPEVIVVYSQIQMVDVEQIIIYLKEHRNYYEIPIIIIEQGLEIFNNYEKYLDLDVDDYLHSSFKSAELLFSINRLLRKNQPVRLHCGDIYINQRAQEVFVKEEKILLTLKEFQLLTYFCSRLNRIITRRELEHNLWHCYRLTSRTLDMHISTLRNKVFTKSNCELLTVVKIGYQIKQG